MTSEMTPNDKDAMAAEYALGLLTGDDFTRAQRLVTTDSDFAQSVTSWEIRLAALTDELVPEKPSAALKTALLAKVFPIHRPISFWERVRVWQAVGAFSLLLLAVVLATDFGRQPTVTGPLYTAEIVSEAGDFRVVAVIDKSRNEVILTRTDGAAPEGRILQVWAHGPDKPAQSVGLWLEGATVRLSLPSEIAAVVGTLTIGVSEEPPGGSLTGLPSGRVFGTIDIPNVSEAI